MRTVSLMLALALALGGLALVPQASASPCGSIADCVECADLGTLLGDTFHWNWNVVLGCVSTGGG